MAATCPTCGADLPLGASCPCVQVGVKALDMALAAMEPDVKVLLAAALKELATLPVEEVRRMVEEARTALLGGGTNAASPALRRLFAVLRDSTPQVRRLVIAAVLQTCANRLDRAVLQ